MAADAWKMATERLAEAKGKAEAAEEKKSAKAVAMEVEGADDCKEGRAEAATDGDGASAPLDGSPAAATADADRGQQRLLSRRHSPV